MNYSQRMAKELLGGPQRLFAALAVSAALSLSAPVESPEDIKASLEKAATQIEELSPLDIGAYPSAQTNFGQSPLSPSVVFLANTNYPTTSLIALLSDASPQVRTLALELLFRKQDPLLLPRINQLANDTGLTFKRRVLYNFRANAPPDAKMVSQTVGDFSKAMLTFFGVQGDFDEFWAERKSRPYWFSWLRSRLLSTGGQGSPNPGLRKRLLPLREMIDGFPETDRNLYLIWLQAEYREPALADDAEIADAVRRLGPENILAIAAGRPPSTDPDLRVTFEPCRYRHITSTILDRAQGVLQAADAPRLAAIYQQENERLKQHPDPRDCGPGMSYVITQARLAPDQAGDILHAEISAHNTNIDAGYRAQLAAALLGIRGRAELPFIRQLFYSEGNPEVITLLDKSNQSLVEVLLSDPRLGTLSPAQISAAYQKFPSLDSKILLDWFFAQKGDPGQAGNSIDYFLTILISLCDHSTYRQILTDQRLPTLPLPILFALEQKLSYYDKHGKLLEKFSHESEISQYFVDNRNPKPSEEAISELIGILKSSAKHIEAKNATFTCQAQ